MNENIIQIKGICKSFSKVQVLRDIDIDIKKNTVHCIVGENGAGKSTLIKLLTGAETIDKGTILLDEQPYRPKNTKHALDNGISTLFQELNIVDGLTILDNLTLGKETSKCGVIQKNSDTRKRYQELLDAFLPDVSLNSKVSSLSIGQKQLVEIVKAVATEAKVIIMDEPTAALSEEEVLRLFNIIAELKKNHTTIIYISHRLAEIFEIGDYVTVMRDGAVVDTLETHKIENRSQLIKMMTGKMVTENYIENAYINREKKQLEIKNLNNHMLHDINFDLYEGEILGFYGLIGSGKTEIARAIYGVDKTKGEILVEGKKKTLHSPKDAIDAGIVMLPEERRTQGLCTVLSIKENIPMMNAKSITSKKFITSKKRENKLAGYYIERLKIKCKDAKQQTAFLSGGNQQKVVFAKCMNAKPKILLLDEPTRGVDVGAKEEIYRLMRECSKQKMSIIVFSSDLPEIIGVCDRMILMREGSMRAVISNSVEFGNDESNTDKIMRIINGVEEEEYASN